MAVSHCHLQQALTALHSAHSDAIGAPKVDTPFPYSYFHSHTPVLISHTSYFHPIPRYSYSHTSILVPRYRFSHTSFFHSHTPVPMSRYLMFAGRMWEDWQKPSKRSWMPFSCRSSVPTSLGVVYGGLGFCCTALLGRGRPCSLRRWLRNVVCTSSGIVL